MTPIDQLHDEGLRLCEKARHLVDDDGRQIREAKKGLISENRWDKHGACVEYRFVA